MTEITDSHKKEIEKPLIDLWIQVNSFFRKRISFIREAHSYADLEEDDILFAQIHLVRLLECIEIEAIVKGFINDLSDKVREEKIL